MARGSSPLSPGWRVFMISLVWYIVSLFYDTFMTFTALRDIFYTPMALFVLKLPSNTN